MPVARVSLRRRSSLANGLTPIKPGRYGIAYPSPRNVIFAPNVTPGTYIEPEPSLDTPEPSSPEGAIFPPSPAAPPPATRKRTPAGKRLSQGYIPRPANAFMLFRADFVRQKHVPGSIETNHSSLSKIIGNCWHALTPEEKKVWEQRAKKEKLEHQKRWPDYRFRPVHKKNKSKGAAAVTSSKRKDRNDVEVPDERRCEEIAHLLLEGKKNEELAAAVRLLDYARSRTASASPALANGIQSLSMNAPTPLYPGRRSSSVPPPSLLYNPIMIPSAPYMGPSFVGGSRAPSPVSHISRSQRHLIGQRRASSVQPRPSRSWTYPMGFVGQMHPEVGMPEPWQLQRDWSPLPEPDTSLFETSYLNAGGMFASSSNSSSVADSGHAPFTFPECQQSPHGHTDLALSISPLDSIPPDAFPPVFGGASTTYGFDTNSFSYPAVQDPLSMPNMNMGAELGGDMRMQWTPSGPSSAFSGSPSPSETSLPMNSMGPESVHAPRPQTLETPAFDRWTQQTPEMGVQGLPLSDMQHHDTMTLHMGMDVPDASFHDYTHQSQDSVFSSEYNDMHSMANSYTYAEGITGY